MPSAISSGKPLILGHRGVRGASVPENSIAAFAEAIRQGADGIELDARLCASGEVVVFHDKTLEALSNGSGRVKERPLTYLQSLELKSEQPGHRIPTLSQVLEALRPELRVRPDLLVNVEIKGEDASEAVAAVLAAELAEGVFTLRNLLVSHFKHRCLLPVQEQLPRIALGLLYEQPTVAEQLFFRQILRDAMITRAAVVLPPVSCFRQGILAERLQAEGLTVMAWTSGEQPEQAKENALLIKQQGISLITDYPQAIRTELG